MCQSSSKNAVRFGQFVNLLPLIKLPYTTTCDGCCGVANIENAENFSQFIPDGWEVIGRLTTTDDFTSILFAAGGDYLSPVIATYDSYGVRLSEKGFLEDGCGEFIDHSIKSHFSITNSMHLVQIDTIVYYQFDTVADRRGNVIKLEVNKSGFTIGNDGQIVKEWARRRSP